MEIILLLEVTVTARQSPGGVTTEWPHLRAPPPNHRQSSSLPSILSPLQRTNKSRKCLLKECLGFVGKCLRPFYDPGLRHKRNDDAK